MPFTSYIDWQYIVIVSNTFTQDKKDKKKDKKREKKRSRQTSRDEGPSTSADPTTRGEANHLEAILLSYFKTVDVENNGLVASKAFWEV